MNSRIIDPGYIHWQETKQWDEIVASCMEIMYNTSIANDGIIFLDFEEEECDDDSFLFKIAKLCNTTETHPIYINSGYFRVKAIKKLNPNFKVKKATKRDKKTYIPTSAESLKSYIQIYMPEIYTDDIFEKIYAEYWDSILNSTEIEDEEEMRIDD